MSLRSACQRLRTGPQRSCDRGNASGLAVATIACVVCPDRQPPLAATSRWPQQRGTLPTAFFAGAGSATRRSRRVVARPLCRRQRLRRVLVDNLCPLEHLRTRVRSHMRAPPGSRRGGEQAHSPRQRERSRATLYVTGFAVRAHTPTAIACARGRKNDGQGAACRSPHGQELGHWRVRAPRRATPSGLQGVVQGGGARSQPSDHFHPSSR